MVAKNKSISSIFRQSKKQQLNKKTVEVDKKITFKRDKMTKDEAERILVKFDLDPSFGPCSGLTRKERFLLAKKLGLNPANNVLDLISTFELFNSHFDKLLYKL